MVNSFALRLFAILILVSGTCVPPAAAGPRGPELVDFALTAAAEPDPVDAGGQVMVMFTVRNNGPDSGGGATVTTTTPAGTTFASATSSSAQIQGPSPGGTGSITATFSSNIPPFEFVQVEIVFNVTPDAGPTLTFQGTVAPISEFADDQNAANDDAEITVEVTAGPGTPADVAVEITPLADEAGTDALFSYDVDVTNVSDGEDEIAQGVTVTIGIPEGASFADVDSVDDGCSMPQPGGSGTVVCSYAEIAPGETVTTAVTVKVFASPGQQLDLTASVQTTTPDPDASNNAAEVFVDVVPSPPAMLDWDEPDADATVDFPPPRNLIVDDDAAPAIARFEISRPLGARRDTVTGYNVYGSTTPGVAPSPGTLLTSVPPSQTSAMVPAAPSGTFFVVTATYASGESAPSNEASGEVPAGSISSVKPKSAKLTVSGSNFSATVLVFVDGIPFVSPAKVKKAGTKVVQKGNLITGESAAVYLRTHPNVLVTVRNSNGGIAAFRYPN